MRLRLLMIGLVFCGLALTLPISLIAAQGGGGGQFVGGAECSTCHRSLVRGHAGTFHALALQNTQTDKAPILADFSQGEDLRTVQFPGESTPRPFTAADIAYVMGAGRYAQSYLYEVEPGQYMVLPAQWSTVDGSWRAFSQAGRWPDPAYDWANNCAYCHTTGWDVAENTWVEDGVQCEMCHGPAAEHVTLANENRRRPSSEELSAIRGAIYNQPDPQVCGQCHNSGMSADGFPYPTSYRPGDTLADAYTLNMPGPDSTHWWRTGHAAEIAMNYNEWLTSAHSALPATLMEYEYASDECLRCHSGDYRYNQRVLSWFAEDLLDGQPPAPITLENARIGIACQTCHNPHSEEEYAFYLVNEPYPLCVECHSNQGIEGYIHHPNREMFEGLSLDPAIVGIPSPHFTAEGGPDCVTCHMSRLPAGADTRASHALRPILPGAPHELEVTGGCTSCHDTMTTVQMAIFIHETQRNTRERTALARAAMTEESPAWVDIALSTIEGDGSGGLHNVTLTASMLQAVENELGLTQPVGAGVHPSDTPPPAWVELPIVGRVEGLTVGPFIFLALAFPVLLVLGLFVIQRGRWQILGVIFLLGATGVLMALLVMFFPPAGPASATGSDSYCMLCHAADQVYTLADGTTLSLYVDTEAMEASVHGVDSSTGRLGCVDCHGLHAYPHTAPPDTLRAYRMQMSAICADCHKDSLAHYEAVLKENIAVGCADCHSAHEVQPANSLYTGPALPLPTETPIPPAGG